MWELSRVGELGRRARCGGGVVDMALGLLAAEAVGDDPGDDGSTGGRLPAKRQRTFSSSEGVLISTSFSNEDRNEGTASSLARAGDRAEGPEPFVVRSARLGTAMGDREDEASLWVAIRRVRGRFSRRVGSGGGSTGDPVSDDFRLRLAGLAFSVSMALSMAPHARRSSGFSRGGVWTRRPWSLAC